MMVVAVVLAAMVEVVVVVTVVAVVEVVVAVSIVVTVVMNNDAFRYERVSSPSWDSVSMFIPSHNFVSLYWRQEIKGKSGFHS
jgi:hypothetical protein